MANGSRALARSLLGLTRTPTYYLPWLTRPGIDCTLVLSNVEARFKVGWNHGPYPLTIRQRDADGVVVGRHELMLRDVTDIVELPLGGTNGYGFVTVAGEHVYSDLYVTLSDGQSYTATHGRGEWIEHYAAHARLLHAVVGAALAGAARTVPAFTRHQYVYASHDSRSHLLVLNLSDVTNRIRVTATREGAGARAQLLTIPPLGARMLDVNAMVDAVDEMRVWRLQLAGNAWFNLYVVGTGRLDLAGPLSLMHVK